MNLSLALSIGLFFLSGPALAQSSALAGLPVCAAQCFEQSLVSSDCSQSDFPCLCADTEFMTAVSGCQTANCTVKETLTSTNATVALCDIPQNDASATIVGIPASFGSLALLMVILRVVDRIWSKKVGLGWDDYSVVTAMLLALPLNFLCFAMAHHGMGKDLWTLTFPNITMTLKLLYVTEIFYMPAEMFVQLSLLAFYIRVFVEDANKIYIKALIGIVAAFGIANTFTLVFQCTPVPYFWTSWTGDQVGHCININLFSWIRAAIEIAIDVVIIVIPLPMLLKLHMNWRKKLQVMAMFSVGFVITLISILRLRSLVKFAKSANVTFDNSPAVYWSVLECDIYIICACMPAMRTLLQKFLPTFLGSTDPHGYSKGMSRDGIGKSGYQRHVAQNSSKGGGGIMKSVDVDLYHQKRSESDIELVDAVRSNAYGAWTTGGRQSS